MIWVVFFFLEKGGGGGVSKGSKSPNRWRGKVFSLQEPLNISFGLVVGGLRTFVSFFN